MKTKLIIIIFLLTPLILFCQDVTVFLEAQYEEVAQQLDSILVEDLTTQTSVMLTEFDAMTTNYEINLIKLSAIESYGNNNITLETNLPGKARVNINSLDYNDIYIQMYDLSGKTVIQNQIINSSNSNIIDINIGRSGIYILKLITAGEFFSYKLIGEQNDNNITISTSKNYYADGMLKSSRKSFCYQEGDTVRFTVYTTGFHSNLVEKIPVNNDKYTTYLSKPCDCGTLTDVEGNLYNTVQIGNQCWMKENLRVKVYANGAFAGEYPDMMNSCSNTPSNINENITENGLEYIWNRVTLRELPSDTLADIIQGICPNGWHIPSDEEWMELERYLGMNEDELELTGWRGNNLAKKLKEPGTIHWLNYDNNKESTNETGFSVLGCIIKEKSIAFFTSTQADHYAKDKADYVVIRLISLYNDGISRGMKDKTGIRACVRCIKNNF